MDNANARLWVSPIFRGTLKSSTLLNATNGG